MKIFINYNSYSSSNVNNKCRENKRKIVSRIKAVPNRTYNKHAKSFSFWKTIEKYSSEPIFSLNMPIVN